MTLGKSMEPQQRETLRGSFKTWIGFSGIIYNRLQRMLPAMCIVYHLFCPGL